MLHLSVADHPFTLETNTHETIQVSGWVRGTCSLPYYSGPINLGRDVACKGESMVPVAVTESVLVLLPHPHEAVPIESIGEEVLGMLLQFETSALAGELGDLSEIPEGEPEDNCRVEGLSLIASVGIVFDSQREVYMAIIVCRTAECSVLLQDFINRLWGSEPQCGGGPRAYAAPLGVGSSIEGRLFYSLPPCGRCLSRLDRKVSGTGAWLPCTCTEGQCECLALVSCRVCATTVKCMGVAHTVGDPATLTAVACSKCGTTQDIWQCLVCGELGCSRYRHRHAAQHFRDSQHEFSICLGTQEVWDYASDEFAHRVVYRCHNNGVDDITGQPTQRLVFDALELGYPRNDDAHHPTFPKGIKGSTSLVDDYLDDPTKSKEKKCPLDTDDNDEVDTGADVLVMKYDAKVDTLCAEFSSILSDQMAQQRQVYESRLESLLGSAASARAFSQIDAPVAPESLITEIRSEVSAATQAYLALQRTNSEVRSLASEEDALQASINQLKASIRDIMTTRQEEIDRLNRDITEQQQVLEDLSQNISTRDRFTATYGAEAFNQATAVVFPTGSSSSTGANTTRRPGQRRR